MVTVGPLELQPETAVPVVPRPFPAVVLQLIPRMVVLVGLLEQYPDRLLREALPLVAALTTILAARV